MLTDLQKDRLRMYLNEELPGDYLADESLSNHTWYRIGGPADFVVYPKNMDALLKLLRQCRNLEIDVLLIGEGANILVNDSGFRGVVIKLTKYFNSMRVEGHFVFVDAGILLKDLILYCEKKGLGGLEYLSGIPGTVGGALIMNAGTHKAEIGDRVREVTFMDSVSNCCTLQSRDIDFGYRSVPQLTGKIVLSSVLNLYPGDESSLRDVRLEQIKNRAAKQPLEYKSCGSVFKRPNGYYVGAMVEEAGLKGLRYGDAMISDKHAGFIVNLGNAKASEVLYLIDKIKREVFKLFSVELEPEVRFVGF